MGLYDRVISFICNKHPGLLKLAENELKNNPAVFFCNEARKRGITKTCILSPVNGFYKFYVSFGFSEQSVSESISTSDFWNGTLLSSDWVSSVHENASPYLQLFSQADISDITKLYIKRFSESDNQYIFIAAETEQNKDIPLDILDSLIISFRNYISKKNGC